ncbi:hypothetical protein [Falsirhodobacter sp. alg1]|uniref:hypothetical protein n=1 Tax=Falsirhodobacter sp. alg1 TaxID=1472418 RepID=UPI0005EE8398|nr:hypothetical protein [Falsirhodobacter sp. alg1]
MSTTILSPRNIRTPLAVSDLPLVIYPGPIHDHWTQAARTKGFDLIARVRDRLHVALRCQTCGGIHTARHSVVMSAQPLCPHCIEARWRQTALTANLTWLGRDQDHRHYGRYRLACGHEVRRQFAFIERIAAGAVAVRCAACLVQREEAEAARFGWSRLGRDPQGNASYRLYRHTCGHEQRIAVANVRWGQCDCAGCGQSWTAKPSYIYLLDIRHSGTGRHVLKIGYSARPVKRHKHQLGLPKDALVEVLRVVAMPTGHDACTREKAAHADLRLTHPESIVPHPDYADLMNVVSEVYRPESLPFLQETLDRIEADIVDAARIRTPDLISPLSRTAGLPDPEIMPDDPDSRPSTVSPRRFSARTHARRKPQPRTISRDRSPILRRHPGRPG